MRVDGQDPSFGGSTVSGLEDTPVDFPPQVTLAVPEPWVTSDSRLVGSLLVAEWWPDSDSEMNFVCQEDAALLPEQQKAWAGHGSLLHASCFSYQQFLHCLLVANFPSFQRSLQCQRSMILGPHKRAFLMSQVFRSILQTYRIYKHVFGSRKTWIDTLDHWIFMETADEEFECASGDAIVLACDGVFDVLSSSKASDFWCLDPPPGLPGIESPTPNLTSWYKGGINQIYSWRPWDFKALSSCFYNIYSQPLVWCLQRFLVATCRWRCS